ncbi:hypothetical protein [Caenispirillum salinarum]|uniref:3'-5' exonuclease n=1 Tax=Caenispirillum salinarum TaxID=859058 RepID=UPI0038512070
MMISFLDIEASSLRNGYPIEIAWCNADVTAGRSWLIRPGGWPPHLAWDDDAERIHGLTIGRLEAEGLPPDTVAEALADDLTTAEVVLSDNPPFDHGWLVELYGLGSGTRSVPFQLEEADAVAVDDRRRLAAAGVDPVSRTLAADAGLVPHRALDDCIRHAVTLCVARDEELDTIKWKARRLLAEHGRDR